VYLSSILQGIAGTPEIKRICEGLINDPQQKKDKIPIIVEKMKVFRESEVKYTLQFVLKMSYLIDPLVVNYIQNGGAKSFGDVIAQINKNERKKLLEEAIKHAGVSTYDFDIYTFDIVVKYLDASDERDMTLLTSAIKEILEQRNNKKMLLKALLNEKKIDINTCDEKVKEELHDFVNNDTHKDAEVAEYVDAIEKKLQRLARKRKPNPAYQDTETVKKSKKDTNRKRKTKVDDEEYIEGPRRKPKAKSKSNKKSKTTEEEDASASHD